MHTDGKKYPIANPATFEKFNFDWKKIHTIPEADIDKIKTGLMMNSVGGKKHAKGKKSKGVD